MRPFQVNSAKIAPSPARAAGQNLMPSGNGGSILRISRKYRSAGVPVISVASFSALSASTFEAGEKPSCAVDPVQSPVPGWLDSHASAHWVASSRLQFPRNSISETAEYPPRFALCEYQAPLRRLTVNP